MKSAHSRIIASLIVFSLTGLLSTATTRADEQPQWKPLFDGKTLEGWIQRGGKAIYRVEDGIIVGSSVPNTSNSFLCTERDYGDFELELEYLVDPRMNSGIQIRSKSLPDYHNGRVHGYQVEIDPSERAWSAGIYDEGRRGWLYPLTDNPAAQKAFKQNEWNKYRVVAVGDSIKTWINDVPAADLVDSMTLTGFIALQVHATKETEPLLVKWRNLRIKDLGKREWKPLFDGKSLAGWKTSGDGKLETTQGVISCRGGDAVGKDVCRIYSDREFKEATVRFMFMAKDGVSELVFAGCRMPLCGPSVGIVTTADRTTTHSPAPADIDKWYKVGDWNSLTVSVHGKRVVVHLNDQRCADFELAQPAPAGPLTIEIQGQRSRLQLKQIELLTPGK